jgi:hypothetical protein
MIFVSCIYLILQVFLTPLWPLGCVKDALMEWCKFHVGIFGLL